MAVPIDESRPLLKIRGGSRTAQATSMTTLPTAFAVGDVAQRGGRLLQREAGADVGRSFALGEQLPKLGVVLPDRVRVVGGEGPISMPTNVIPLEHHQVQRDSSGSAGRVAQR